MRLKIIATKLDNRKIGAEMRVTIALIIKVESR